MQQYQRISTHTLRTGAFGLLFVLTVGLGMVSAQESSVQSLRLESLIRAAETTSPELERLNLERELLENRETLRLGIEQPQISLSTGTQGISYSSRTDQGHSSLTATPVVQLNLPRNQSLRISAPLELVPQLVEGSSIQGTLEYQLTLDDLVSIPDSASVEYRQGLEDNLRAHAQTRLDIAATIIATLQTIHSEHQKILQAESALESVGQKLDTARKVDNLAESSLAVQELLEEQFSGELTISLATLALEAGVTELGELTGILELTPETLLAIPLDQPDESRLPTVPALADLTSLRTARASLERIMIQDAEAMVSYDPQVRLTAGAGGRYTTDQLSGSLWAGAVLENPGAWDIGLSVTMGSTQNPQDLWNITLSGSWTSENTKEEALTRRNSQIQVNTAQLALDQAISEGQRQIRNLASQITSLETEIKSWRLQTQVRQTALDKTAQAVQSGLSSASALEQARRNLELSRIQGRMLALNILSLEIQQTRITL